MADTALDGIPEVDRVSLRAVLVIEGQDPTEALAAAGITDPVVVPVVFGDGSAGTNAVLDDGLPAVLEYQTATGGSQQDGVMRPAAAQAPHQGAMGSDDDPASGDSNRTAAELPPPRTVMLPPGPSGQALAPIRPRR